VVKVPVILWAEDGKLRTLYYLGTVEYGREEWGID